MNSLVHTAESNSSSYVHYLETESRAGEAAGKDAIIVAKELELQFRHSGTSGRRWRIRKALELLHPEGTRLERWDECGRFATVEESVDRPGHYRITCARCHDRFCPSCGGERSRTISRNVAAVLDGKVHRFLTLTVRHGREPLHEILDKLMTGWKALRRSRLWRTTVRGGAAFIEVKYVNGWHPHIHAVLEGSWICHKDLVKEWLKATGDSSVVDIQLVKDTNKTVNYVAKYASKPLDRSVINDERRCVEAIGALKGRKLLMTFGDWRGKGLCDVETDEVWNTVASLVTLVEREQMGDPFAIKILKALRSQITCRQEERDQKQGQDDG